MLATFLCLVLQPPADPFVKWEKDVSTIEKRHKESPPKKGGIVFAGSSTVVRWDLKKSFPDWDVANCGFGGNQIADNTHFAPRLIFPLEPRAIVFYAGDNDLNAGRTPDQVLEDFRGFMKGVHEKLPECKVYFLSVKPSVARWSQFEAQAKANALVRFETAANAKLAYVDLVEPLLGADGKPEPDLYVKDGLHLSEKGYERVADAVKKAVK